MITDKIDSTTYIPSSYLKTVVPPPKSIKVSLDDRCQFQCSFCSRKDAQSTGEMPFRMFQDLVDQMVEHGIKELGLFYIGEPMLAKNLADAIKYAKNAGIEYVFLTTNGALATESKVKSLMAAGLDSLKFSFNYADGNQLRQVAGVSPSNYQKIVDNIKTARKVKDDGGYQCGIYASSIMFDGIQGEKMQAAVNEILPYVDEHYWLPLLTFGGKTNIGEIVGGNPGRLHNMRDRLPCWATMREGHITASGDISLCCFETSNEWVVGNLATHKFMDAWNSPKAQELRAAHLAWDVHGTACEKCIYGGEDE